MSVFNYRRRVGLFFVSLGLLLLLAVFGLPYLRLLGKEKISLGDEPPPSAGPRNLSAVLPVFFGLRTDRKTTAPRFYLTIKKLGIVRAVVSPNVFVDNSRPDYLNSLLASLGHLKGSVLPGDRGNSVVFGHSALPYLYNPRSYQTIFSRLDQLSFGDLIEVEVDSQTYRYRVEKGGLLEKGAIITDLSSRKPRLTLLSCYPPGFKTRIYVVRSLLTS